MPTRRRISCRLAFSTLRPGHLDMAGARGVHAVEVQDERRLAGAVGPEHGDPLPRLDPQVDAVERLVTVGVGEGEALDQEGGGHGSNTAVPSTAAVTSTGVSPASQVAGRAATPRSGMAPVQPRDSIARCTRSPRS